MNIYLHKFASIYIYIYIYIYMICCRKYVDDMLRKCAGKMHYTDPAIKGMRQKDTGIIHVTRRRMYITADAALFWSNI
jgi:hypothetical protein